jgi:hypothetical protein
VYESQPKKAVHNIQLKAGANLLWDSLKGRACLMQFFSAPVFVGLGIYATMQQSADSLRSIMDVSPSSSVREISWIIVAMLFAEGKEILQSSELKIAIRRLFKTNV